MGTVNVGLRGQFVRDGFVVFGGVLEQELVGAIAGVERRGAGGAGGDAF